MTSSSGLFFVGIIAIIGVVLGGANMVSQKNFQKEITSSIADISEQIKAPNEPAYVQPAQVLTQSQAEQLVVTYWNVNYNPNEGGVPVTTIQENGDGTYTVVTIVPALDDSISSSRLEGTATYVNGSWSLSSPSRTWSCQPGRGHQNYSTASCI
ncbi:MAG: hypothetical protein OEX08_03500 [Candidatus Nomurabacteria bacterium]|nr:hypothetical protein [Candidatus Nomurabacteria bacterium]